MSTFIGIDGISGGWVAVYLADRQQYFDYGQLGRLLAIPHERAMIDVPIGLPQRGYRSCDEEARKLVGSRVFLGARWNVWKFGTYKSANDHYWGCADAGISMQLWCIRDKLQEVNEAMTPKQQSQLQETHPEMIFWRLNDGKVLASKKTDAGRARRIKLLKQHGFDQIDRWLALRNRTPIRSDDLIDACVCALAARDSRDRLPGGEPPTERGIRMEIWY
jgi:predicted RNase H-like nuclease